jgi:diacylglycerol kinase
MRRNYLVARIIWYSSAVRIAWRDTSFKIWIPICAASILIGVIVGIGMTKLCLLVALAILALGWEMANTALERLCDLVDNRRNPKIKTIKDTFGAVPALAFSAYVICWLILVAPSIYLKVTGG